MKNIYLEPDEEIISVIDRLVQADDDQVNMIVPSGAQIWQSSINLKLLKREADNLGKNVSFVVASDLNAEMAEKIGFNIKQDGDFSAELAIQKNENQPKMKDDMIDFLAEGLESDKKSAKSFFSFAAAPQKRMADIVNAEEEEKEKKEEFKEEVKVNVFSPKNEKKNLPPIFAKKSASSKWPKIFAAFIILSFAAAIAVGYQVLPTTEITVFPKREKVDFDLLVIGARDISQTDESLNKIPLKEISVEKTKSREFLATDERELTKKAKGVITIYNEYSSEPQPLVARTRFESPDGKVFRISAGVTVPGAKIEDGKIIASILEVEVTADQPGAEYNLAASRQNHELLSRIYHH